MIKALFMHPRADIARFVEVGVPLIDGVPGIARWTWNVGQPNPANGAPPAYQLITEIWFKSEDDVQRMLASEELRAARASVAEFNPDPSSLVAVYLIEGREV